MLKHSLLYFVRSIARHKLFSLLNFGGMILGLGALIFMMDFIAFEESFDDYRPDAEQLYRITSRKTQDGIQEPERSSASVYLIPFLKERFPEVVSAVRVHILDNSRQTVIVEENGQRSKFEETDGYHAGPEYFNVFGDRLLFGNPETAFDEPFKMVITESLARKYFGRIDVFGKTVTLVDDEAHQYTVSGVVEDPPRNSHFKYDYLISLKTLETLWPRARWTAWNWDYFHSYIKVRSGVDMNSLERRINHEVSAYGKDVFLKDNYTMDFQIQPLIDIHLHSNLGREFEINGNGDLLFYVYIIALFVIILAWVNYINLTTSMSSLRAKEIGIRKVSGAHWTSLFRQFLFESFLINLISFAVALVAVVLSSPLLFDITGHEFGFYVFNSYYRITLLLIIFLSGCVISGFYPSWLLSRFKTSMVLKGNFKNSRQGIGLRKVLVVFQFAISLILMIATLAIYKQVNYLRHRDLGINLDQVLVVHAPNIRTDKVWEEFDYLKERALQNSSISTVSASNQVPGNVLYHTELFKKKSHSTKQAKVAAMVWVDHHFLEVYDLQLLAGKDFVQGSTDNTRGLIINTSMMEDLGFVEPRQAVGQPITWVHSFGALTELKIIGVVNDFDQQPLGTPQPMAMLMNRFYRWNEMAYYLFKIDPISSGGSVQSIKDEYNKMYPNETFKAFFLEDHFNQQYLLEERFGNVFLVFTILAIAISNLGLFGLTFFVLMQRRKEMSLRKVLGASIQSLFALISRQVVLQFAVALVLGLPIILLVLDQWLQRFAYRMQVSPELILGPVALLAFLAIATVYFITVRVTSVNPVKNLRNE